jgi:GTP cyclohydrolase-4
VANCTGLVSVNAAGENYLSTFIPEDTHQQILDRCPDVPEGFPSFPLPLQRVGISGKTVWVGLVDNKGGYIPFSATILVNLDANRRGIHMSRIEQAITSLHGKEFNSLPAYGIQLGNRILKTQNAHSLSLELTGYLPLISQAPVSKLNSIDTIEVIFKLALGKNKAGDTSKAVVGATVHHLTACPCTLAYNEVLFNRFNDPWPQATHSQRSKTQLLVSPPHQEHLPSFQDLTFILDSALHISQDLLKRPDETELVLKAHRNPQFAEDTVREVAWAAGEKFKNSLDPETRIEVHSLSQESIHIHDVQCSLDTRLRDILTTLQTKKLESKHGGKFHYSRNSGSL